MLKHPSRAANILCDLPGPASHLDTSRAKKILGFRVHKKMVDDVVDDLRAPETLGIGSLELVIYQSVR